MVENFGKNVFILGIGGISLSGIALILKNKGHEVRGTDKVRSKLIENLEQNGVKILESTRKGVLWADTIIYTSAIPNDSSDLLFARGLGKNVLTRAEALAKIADEYNTVIAVAGSHGKTTTTGMLADIFDECGLDLTAHIGGILKKNNSNIICRGKNELFVTEACEYKRSFLTLNPDIGVILNIDLDHTDTYPTIDDMVDAFVEFADNIRSCLIINSDNIYSAEVISRTKKNKRIITYSIKDKSATYYALVNDDQKHFELMTGGRSLGVFESVRHGEHNIYNALVSLAVVDILGKELIQAKKTISCFDGILRRHQKLGEINGAPVIMDYAHHPAEIEKEIAEARAETDGKIYVVFQPHTYSRTKALWGRFVESLALADSVVLYPIYPARETKIRGVTSERLGKDLRSIKKSCYYSDDLFGIYTYLGYFVTNRDIVLVLGAGDIEKFADLFK